GLDRRPLRPRPPRPLMNDETFLTVREAVLEIRGDVKELGAKLDRIDRDGSIGTKAELEDHEHRLRLLESSGFRFAGALTFAAILLSFTVGVAGLVVHFF